MGAGVVCGAGVSVPGIGGSLSQPEPPSQKVTATRPALPMSRRLPDRQDLFLVCTVTAATERETVESKEGIGFMGLLMHGNGE